MARPSRARRAERREADFRRSVRGGSTRGRSDRGGYAMLMVVLLLGFMLLMAGTSYELVAVLGDVRAATSESALAELSAESISRRFMGEGVGTPRATDTYQDGQATVTVVTRRVARLSGHRTAYLLSGSAEYGSPYPAKRTIREFAILEPPVEPLAVVSVASGTLTVSSASSINGTDAATSGACTALTGNIGGAFAVTTVNPNGAVTGNPATRTVGTVAAAVATLGARWDFLTNAETPALEGSWPSFSTIPADSFPVIRIRGDFAPTLAHNGRGTLIVTGTFRPGNSWSWNGVVLSGKIASNLLQPGYVLRGLLVTGLDPTMGNVTLPAGLNAQYNRCNVMRAFAPLSHLERVIGSTWTDG